MPKRKAESPPEIDERPEVSESKLNPDQDVPTVEPCSTSDRPTGKECPREPTESHLSPTRSEVDEGSIPECISFWDLLSLAGYETWGG